MQMLSRKSLYALHALICIAGNSKTTVQANWISKTRGIPRKFLEVIMLDLKKAGILGSKQGKGGGYFLKRRPSDITLLDIINIIDGGFLMVPCLGPPNSCQMCLSKPACLLKERLTAVVSDAQRALVSYCILDFVEEDPVPDLKLKS